MQTVNCLLFIVYFANNCEFFDNYLSQFLSIGLNFFCDLEFASNASTILHVITNKSYFILNKCYTKTLNELFFILTDNFHQK